jgi:hypothetical protein
VFDDSLRARALNKIEALVVKCQKKYNDAKASSSNSVNNIKIKRSATGWFSKSSGNTVEEGGDMGDVSAVLRTFQIAME